MSPVLPTIPWKDIISHNKKEDCWLVIHGQVWNLTEFVNQHPGGATIILKYAGKDATKTFSAIHPKDITDTVPQSYLKGVIDPKEVPPVQEEEKTASEAPTELSDVTVDEVLNTYDFELVAQTKCTVQAWAYLNSGGDDEITLRDNTAAFQRIWLRPRVLRDVSIVDTSTLLLGVATRMPLYVSATALGKLYHPRGEMELSEGCAMTNTIYMLPTLGSCTLDEMTSVRQKDQTQWFQLYVNGDRSVTKKVIEKVEKLGVQAIFVTVDSPQFGNRERDQRLKANVVATIQKETGKTTDQNQGISKSLSTFIDPGLNWKDVPWLMSIAKTPIFLKGIQTGEDAILAARSGVRGIVLSNHGGRNADTCRSGIEILEEVMDTLHRENIDLSNFDIYVDGGIRRGSDIFKAIALGAKAVGIGKPAVYALCAFGKEGVERLILRLQEEFMRTMQLCGCSKISDIKREMIITKDLSNHGYPHQTGLYRNYIPATTIKSKL